HYLAYEIEKKKEFKDFYDKLEGLIWDEIQAYNSNAKYFQFSEQYNNEDALIAINKEMESNPKNLQLYYSKSKILVNLNQYRQVLVLLDIMLENFPKEEKNIKLIRAYIFKEMKNPEAGLEIINDLINIYPEEKDLLNYKASWLQYLNKKEESLAIIQNLIEQEPNNALYHDTYGEILMFFKDYKQALEEFQRAIDIDKDGWFIYQTFIKMGICYNVLENFKLAIRFIKKGKENMDKSVSDFDTKRKWMAISDLILAEIEQLNL
ncbi:MAG: tetratricopeptide repeat protein, partial [Candidatus Odinarchaeota archaeon]